MKHTKISFLRVSPSQSQSLAAMAAKLMHAVQYKSFGGGLSGLKHIEIPIPTLKKDEVLLKLEAASLNPGDFKIQKGLARPFLLRKLPHTPVARPPEVSAAEGSSLPVAGLSAHQALTKDAGIKLDRTGELKNILITGAAGGVGLYAVQLPKLGNTHLTATCGARNIELVKSLGADEVLEYRTADGAALKSPSGRKYDFVIDCGKGNPWSTFESNLNAKGCCRHFSDVSSLATFVMKKLTFSKKQQVPLLMIPKDVNLEYLVKLVKEGKLKPVIDSMHPLSKAEDASLKSIDGHATGNIILEL
ncbi:unnamed protein product [Malus baccata var. baccata]